MILNPPERTAEKCIFLQKNALSCRQITFPAEKCTFLQKNAVVGGAHRRKRQEIAGGPQGSRVKNASQPSQEKRPPEKFTLKKFTSQNSTQKSGQKIHIAPLQGHLAENPLRLFLRKNLAIVATSGPKMPKKSQKGRPRPGVPGVPKKEPKKSKKSRKSWSAANGGLRDGGLRKSEDI